MAVRASMLKLLQAVRIALLCGHVGVSCLDLNLFFKTTYNRDHRQHSNESFVMATCGVPHSLHCERLCTMTSGCKSFFYSPLTGACQFHSGVASCPNDETHQSAAKHAGLYFYRVEGCPMGQPRKWTRLLFGPERNNERMTFQQLSLHSNTIKTYAYLRKSELIISIAYMPTARRLLVSTKDPGEIWDASLDSTDDWSLVMNVSASHMAVDEDRRLIFFKHPRDGYIGKIYLECKRLENIMEYIWVRGLAVFPKHRLICTFDREKLIIASYGGTIRRIIPVGDTEWVATNLAAAADVLYYSSSGYLMRMSLSQNATVSVAELGETPVGLLFDGDRTVYAYFPYKIITFDVSQRKLLKKKTIAMRRVSQVYVLL